MKKRYFVAVIALLCVLSLSMCGCFLSSSERSTFKYLTGKGEFIQHSEAKGNYAVTFTVSGDKSYVLDVSYGSSNPAKTHAEGKMTYVGCYEHDFTTENWGITVNNTEYHNVIRLENAQLTVEDKTYNLYIVAHAFSKRSDDYGVNLVMRISDGDDKSNLESIATHSTAMRLASRN